MAYYIDIFSPETYEAFVTSKQDVSGVRERYENMAKRVKVGDKLICYITKLSRWIGVLEVISDSFRDTTPRFKDSDDPYIIRFKVKVLALLPKEKAIPIKEDTVWNQLSFTKEYDKSLSRWTGRFRGGLNAIQDADGKFLEELILSQVEGGKTFPIDEHEYAKLRTHQVHSLNKVISVSVPQEAEPEPETSALPQTEVRQSVKVQTLLAGIGANMGLKIWIPRNDRAAVLAGLRSDSHFLDVLPLNYDETTLRTIEQIDVLWLRGRGIIRAFEVEHSTSIYSGILRMADLLALQPNMNIKLHIVAPLERRDKVFHELRRPVFSLLEAGPLAERCTYLSYDSIEEIGSQKHLAHLSDSVLDEYAEEAE